jgi:hypothetical protein
MLQDSVAVLSRQIDIQYDQRGTGHVGIAVSLIEESYRLLSILHNVESDIELRRLDRILDQEHVGFIVLRDKHVPANAGGPILRRGA